MRALLAIWLLLLACACVKPPAGERTTVLRDLALSSDTLWSGRVVIDGTVTVHKGATLTLLPGTEVAFVPRDADQDGLGDATLVIKGRLLANGTAERPIRFRSAAASPAPGDWLEIRAEHSPAIELRYCEINDSAYTLHAHFSKGVVEDSIIRGNLDGCRLGQSNFLIRNCLVEGNSGKGINFRNSVVEVTRNIIRDNRTGIFLFETDRASDIHHNNLYRNGDNLRLGDFFTSDLTVRDNWWGSADPQAAERSVYDRKNDPAIGRVSLAPAASWVSGCGPRDRVALSPAWSFATGGFVDASPMTDGQRLFAASWDGRLYALDPEGRQLWSRAAGEVVDARPALDAERLYLQQWGRQVLAFDRENGRELWRFTYPASNADDHRQGGLARTGDLLLVPAWNGTLYALEAAGGELRWRYSPGMPLRAAPAVDGERIYLGGGDGRLSALSSSGELLWRADLESALLASPALTPEGPVVLTKAGELIAFDRQGRERWRRSLDGPCFYGAPVYRGRELYVPTAAGSLWKLDAASGDLVWRLDLGAPLYATPLVSGGRLFIGDNAGSLHLIDADSGETVATARTGGAIQSTPTPIEGRIVVGSRDGSLHAYEVVNLPAGEER